MGTCTGILYGEPKVHKTVINNIPQFQPILSAIKTPVYKLAKYLVAILSLLTVNAGCPLKCNSKFQLKMPILYMFFQHFSSKKHMFFQQDGRQSM